MTQSKTQELWFLTGSQHLYGADALHQVAERSAREGVAVPAAVAQRATYVFYDEHADLSAPGRR